MFQGITGNLGLTTGPHIEKTEIEIFAGTQGPTCNTIWQGDLHIWPGSKIVEMQHMGCLQKTKTLPLCQPESKKKSFISMLRNFEYGKPNVIQGLQARLSKI